MKKLLVLAMTLPMIFFTACKQSNNENNDKNMPTVQKETMTTTRTTTPSGLSYEILKEGTGRSPAIGNKVTVHYTGWLDQNGNPGTQFDSSINRGKPFTFIIGVGQVIKGWDEGVLSMKIGEKRRLFIPAALGYGARGSGGAIPPHANLIFDVELLSIQ